MATAFIDGENFRKSIRTVLETKGKASITWHTYDFKGLLEKVLKGVSIDHVIFYFARLTEHPRTKDKSKELIEERRLLKNYLEKQGFEVIIAGRVRGHMEVVRGSMGKPQETLTFKEKGVDVRIAVDLVSKSCDGELKEAIIGSSDSDLQPAISEIRKRGVICIYLGFENAPNKGLAYTTNRTILIRNSEVLEFRK